MNLNTTCSGFNEQSPLYVKSLASFQTPAGNTGSTHGLFSKHRKVSQASFLKTEQT